MHTFDLLDCLQVTWAHLLAVMLTSSAQRFAKWSGTVCTHVMMCVSTLRNLRLSWQSDNSEAVALVWQTAVAADKPETSWVTDW